MRPPSSVLLIIFCATLSIAASSFTLLRSLPLATSASRRDIRLLAGNSTDWTYHGCIADSGTIGRVFSLSIIDENTHVNETTAPNDGINTSDLAVIQGLDECAYTGLINGQLVNQVFGDYQTADLPSGPPYWTSPFNAVWLGNVVRTFAFSDALVITRLNATTDGSHTFSPYGTNNMDLLLGTQMYHAPGSNSAYIVYSEGRFTPLYNAVVYKCDIDCEIVGTLGGAAYVTITANSETWFACFKDYSWPDYMCTGEIGSSYTLASLKADYPFNKTKLDQMYSCMMGDTTMILALSNSNDSKYSLYSLNTKSGFSVTGKTPTDGSAVVMSISCMDRVILVATKEGIDYWGWDDGTGFNFPVPEPIATPLGTPGASGPNSASPTFTPANGVHTPSNNNTTDGLTHDNQVLVGVLVGVGVPLLAGATTLILLRKKLHQKKKPEDKESIYSAINVPSKDNPSFSSKMLIPFKQLSFGKEIGSGSFGKVFLGKWRGAVVAIKMNNRVAFTEGFSAEAKLTLSMTPHPNLVQTYGVSIDSDHPYIVLEYCEGGSLDQIVFKQTLGSKEQRAIVLGIAYGLTHLHENKIIHRDLAVRNILLKDGTPKISDFGMSRILKEETSHGKTYTSIGPIRWMAPESVLDMSYSYKSDVWTFGIVVSEIVNGHEPHEGENQLNVAMQIRDEGYTPPIPDDCDPVLRELMQMCWRVNPDDRPTMNEVTDFLNDKLTQQ